MVTLDATNNTIEVAENGGGLVAVTVPPGTYYGHKDPALDATHPSLYLALEAALSAALTGTYTVDAATPTMTTLFEGRGISITRDSGFFSVLCSSSLTATTPDLCDFLGFDRGMLYPSVGTVWTSPYMRDGMWRSTEQRTLAERETSVEIEYSTTFTEREDAYGLDRGVRNIRQWRYEDVQASHVLLGFASEADHAATGEVALGDERNTWERLWRALLRLDDVLVVYYQAGQAPDLLVTTHPYEIVRINDPARTRKLGAAKSFRYLAGSYYDLAWQTVTRSGTYRL